MTDVTRILSAIEQGDPQAAEQLLPLVYDELRKLAAQKLAQEKPGQTLQATALVHEAYLRLVGGGPGPALEQPRPLLRRRGRGHAPHPRRERPPQAGREARRRRCSAWTSIEIDAGRRRRRTTSWPLDEALDAAGQRRSRGRAELVKLRYFAGLTVEEAAEALGISPPTPTATGPYARAWLHAQLAGGRDADARFLALF